MENNKGREQLAREIDRLTDENQSYVLGVSQALVFAQETLNAHPAIPETPPAFWERPNKK